MTADLCPRCFAPARDNGRPGCACAARAAAAAGDSDDRVRDDRDGLRDGRRNGPDSMREGTRDGFRDEIHDDPMGPRPNVTFSGEGRHTGPDLRDIRLFERRTTYRSARVGHEADTDPEQTESAARADRTDRAENAADASRGSRTDAVAAAAGSAAAPRSFEPVAQPIDTAGAARPGADSPGFADAVAAPGPGGHHRKSRRGPVVAVLSGAAAVALAGTLAIGTGLLGGDKKNDQEADRTLSDKSSSAPADDPPTEDDETSDVLSPSPSPSASPSAGPASTPSATRETSPSARLPSRAPTTLKSKEASRTAAPPRPSATDATGSVSPSPTESPTPTGPPVLEKGDSGSEVVELQKRLGRLLIYLGWADGEYDNGVRNAVSRFQTTYDVDGDPKGVYGPHTRRALESRTDEP